jgi:hypothetical protein
MAMDDPLDGKASTVRRSFVIAIFELAIAF